MKKLVLVLAMLALGAFAFAACGGDDDDDRDEVATTPEQTEAPAGGGGGGGGGPAVDISADPGGALEYEQASLEASSGSTDFELTNESSVPHDFTVEAPDGQVVGGTEIITDDITSVTLDLEPGEYTFFCSVDGHRAAGMEGPLTVK